MNKSIILRSAADAAAFGLSWRFVQDGNGYGVIGTDGEFLPVHYDEDGEQDGWEYQPNWKNFEGQITDLHLQGRKGDAPKWRGPEKAPRR